MTAMLLLALAGCDDTIFGEPVGGAADSGVDGSDDGGSDDGGSDDGGSDTGGDGGSDDGGSDTGGGGDDTGAAEEGWCAVQSLFNGYCLSCHSASLALGGLDLETDPYTALVDQPSASYTGRTLVVPGDADTSFLMLKLLGEQGDDGSYMPTTGLLDAALVAPVQQWIDDGASDACSGGIDTGPVEGYHPAGWDEPEQHGMAAKYQEDTCLDCHGADLSGGDVGVSCDTCHDAGWRTDCTFCHGGDDNTTGAPPRDISGETAASALSFSPHTAHVTTNIHTAYDCWQCHQKPTDVLSPGHFLVDDGTPGVAEVDFSAGLSDAATYLGAASCSNLYCHGDGRRDNGTAAAGDDFSDCSDCHPDSTSSESRHESMSGEHADHLEEGLRCSDCHGLTVSNGQVLTGVDNHVNGSVLFDGSVTMSGVTCNGSCHGEYHDDRDWD
jgi:predicted CxxxxCH...CXXCH cytochrome family protein